MNEITIYTDIGDSFFGENVNALSIKKLLDDMTGDINVRINSFGGDVFDGFAIYNLLRQHVGQINVFIDGLAASIASIIAMAGNTITMAENSLMMIHDPWSISVGNAPDHRTTADLLDKIKNSIVSIYQKKTDLEPTSISTMMTEETWFTASEAEALGFATEITDGGQAVSNIAKPWITKAPEPKDIESQTAWRLALNRKRLSLLDSPSRTAHKHK